MASSFGKRTDPYPALRRIAGGGVLAALGLYLADAAIQAMRAPWQIDDFPEALYIKTELLPWTFPLHMVAGGLVLLLIPAMILLRHRPHWHRRLGRITVPVVLAAGVTAFPVALVAPVTPLSALGFTVQGLLWLLFLGLGLRHVRRGNIAGHRAMMLLMAATTTGALFFRIYLALYALYGNPRHYQAFYAFDAWIAWALPLAAMAIFLKRTGAFAANPR